MVIRLCLALPYSFQKSSFLTSRQPYLQKAGAERPALQKWVIQTALPCRVCRVCLAERFSSSMTRRAQRYSEQIFPRTMMMLRQKLSFPRTMMMLRNGVMWLCLDSKLKCTTPYGTAEQPADKMDDPYELGLRVEQ